VGGCKGKGEDGGPKAADFVGKWNEEAVAVSARLQVASETPKERLTLTLNSDNTYRAQVCDAAGAVIAAAGQDEGTWAFADGTVTFTRQTEGLKAKYKNLAPTQAVDVKKIEDGRTVITVVTADESMRNLVLQG
jgi:hypothetical protein